MPYYVLANVGVGLLIVWVYAAIRPRFGGGPRTALVAGSVVWLAGELLLAGNFVIGLAPARLHVTGAAFRLLAALAGALVGARLYREVPEA